MIVPGSDQCGTQSKTSCWIDGVSLSCVTKKRRYTSELSLNVIHSILLVQFTMSVTATGKIYQYQINLLHSFML